MDLPKAFLNRLQQDFPEEDQAFIASLQQKPFLSVFQNPQKQSSTFAEKESVPWSPLGKYLKERPTFALDPLFHAGVYYVQEPSSMFMGHILKNLKEKDKRDAWKVLDLSAAPGGKSINILSQLEQDDFLIANEIHPKRASILKENLIRWGNEKVIVTNNAPKDFQNFEGYFDLVLLDAPCSGEGMFRKDAIAIQEWSEENVQMCGARQKDILKEVLPLVKSGGYLIYSTCTFAPAENEENLNFILSEATFESLQIPIEKDWGIVEKQQNNSFSYHFLPHKVKGEGLFVTLLQRTDEDNIYTFKLKKKAFQNWQKPKKPIQETLLTYLNSKQDWIFWQDAEERIFAFPASFHDDFLILKKHFYLKNAGLLMGEWKKEQLIPSIDLALSIAFVSDAFPKWELTQEEVLTYLRKENLPQLPSWQGWGLVTYQNISLGWVKVLKNRINNYYPSNWRLRMK